jgi:hypothetical protein
MKETIMAESNDGRKKAKSKGFAVLGVPVGSILTYRKDPTITCTVVDDKNKVEYKGKVYPISGLAKELMNTPISGYHAFKFNGVLLAKLDSSPGKPTGQAMDPQPAPDKPSETAQVAPQEADAPVPQTVPLPPPQEAATGPTEAISEDAREDTPAEDDIDPLANFGPDALPEEEGDPDEI